MSRANRDMKRVNFYLPNPLIKFLKKLSTANGVTMSDLTREILESYAMEYARYALQQNQQAAAVDTTAPNVMRDAPPAPRKLGKIIMPGDQPVLAVVRGTRK